MVGRTLSHYKILAEISRGGMGIVYRAMDTKLNREVAIKILPPELVTDPERKRRFLQEAQSAAALHHPHIATVFEIDEADGVTFIAMELIEGEKLRDVLQQERLPVARTLELVTEVAEGLALAHEKGVVHRDLKPGNIMVTKQGHAKIIDFGLAKLVEPLGGSDAEAATAARAETDPGKVMGTLSYMSPEQARGSRVDHRSDIFSLGVVLHELLTGQPPFQGATGADTLSAILKEPVPRLPALGAEVSPEAASDLQKCIDKCLAKDPGKRYQTMSDLVVDLRALWRRVESGSMASVAAAPVQAPSGKKVVFAIAAIAAAAVLSLAAYSLLSRQSTSTEEATPVAQRKKIAVLPFENLGPPEDEYFADGMTEEITSRLAGVSGLGVISRSSAVQYKDTDKKIDQIGEELGVEYLLEGTVRWQKGTDDSPGRVRVTPQLIRVSDDTHLWSEVYDHVTEDLFQVQSDIAEQVIGQLDVTLLAPEREELQARPTKNPEAHQAYIRGINYLWSPDILLIENSHLAQEWLEKAIQLDPQFARAYADLASANAQFYNVHGGSPERLARAERAVAKAFELEPDLPEAHRAQALIYYWGHGEYDRALEALALAAKGLPNDSLVRHLMGSVRRRQGDFEKSLELMNEAFELDPRSSILPWDLGQTLTWLRRYAEADRHYKLNMAIAPGLSIGNQFMAVNEWLWDGDLASARAALESMPDQNSPGSTSLWARQLVLEQRYEEGLGKLSSIPWDFRGFPVVPPLSQKAGLYDLLGRHDARRATCDEARILAEKDLEVRPERHVSLGVLAFAYACLGRGEEAIQSAKKNLDLMPITKDALAGTFSIKELALVFTIVGEHDAALEQLDRLLSIPAFFSVALMELEPEWEPLRKHPVYQELVQNYR